MAKPLAGGIAKAVYKGLKAAKMLAPVTLLKESAGTRTPGNIAGGTNPTATSYGAQGFVDDYATSEIDGTLVVNGDRRVYVFGASLAAGITPTPNDKVTIGGVSYRVVNVGSDPANAVFICQARGAATP